MNDDFERIVSLKSKPKVKIKGELKGKEVICNFAAAPFLSLFITEESHSMQLSQPMRVNTNVTANCFFLAHQEKLFLIPVEAYISTPFIFNSTQAEIVGEIVNRQLVFNKELPHNTFFGRGLNLLSKLYPSVELRVLLPEKEFLLQTTKPVFIGIASHPCFIYRNRVIEIDGIEYRNASPTIIVPDEDALLVKHFVLTQEHAFDKMKTQVEAFERFEKALKSKREPLPEEVKMYVWRRDEGKCVVCGGQRNLEFDHIIPLSRGGSNTERNIQLLCETCNRQKSNNI